MTRAVLTFHSVDDSESVLSFPTRAFAGLVERLVISGTPVVNFAELRQRADGVVLTFDDGMRSVYRSALPVLREHGLPAHLFLTTGHIGGQMSWPSVGRGKSRFDMLDWDEIESCAQYGVQIESHTVSHPDLRDLSPQQMIDECSAADEEIERHVGRRPELFAFPFGLSDESVRRTLSPRYTACFSTKLGYFDERADLSCIPRLDSYYLKASVWYGRPLGIATRTYVALRGLVRSLRGRN